MPTPEEITKLVISPARQLPSTYSSCTGALTGVWLAGQPESGAPQLPLAAKAV
jgi:hypothetical protein